MDNADPLMAANHKVRSYKEYQVYVPSLELGLSQPLSRQRVCPSPRTKRGGSQTRLQVRGWGSPNSDNWRKGLALCLLCAANDKF
jgi:hypothetical protein